MACRQSGVNLRVYVNGLEVKTLQDRNDDSSQDLGHLYGAGANPIATTKRRKTFSGNFKMLKDELPIVFPPLGDPNIFDNAIVSFVDEAADGGGRTTRVDFGGVCFNLAQSSATTDAEMIEADISFVATTRVVL